MNANQPKKATPRPSQAEMAAFQKKVQLIEKVLDVLAAGELTPDLLDLDVADVIVEGLALGPGEARSDTLAAYLYSVALECRQTVENFAAAGRMVSNWAVLIEAFEGLIDVWSSYRKTLSQRDIARWGAEPSPDQIWTALEGPRRRYIKALDKYLAQLLVVAKP